MHLKGTPPALVLSASDLSSFVGCRHRTALDLGVALGELAKPSVFSLHAQDLRDRGAEHERQYVASLEVLGLSVTDLQNEGNRVGATVEALRRGVDVVIQGELLADGWFGRPDILRRVESPSDLGSWSYEVYDTKLARETRGSTILQLAVYSELLGRVQGCMPTAFHVVTPDPDNGLHAYRVDDYSAYYRLAKQLLAQCLPDVGKAGGPTRPSPVHQALADAHYPEPTDQCDYCRWTERCEARRRADDHLSYIAGASRLQRAELVAREVTTLAQAAGMLLPIAFKPTRGSKGTYARLREQARVQLEQRERGRPVWELLERPSAAPDTPIPPLDPVCPAAALPQPRQGLHRLPTPSPSDIFLDLEAARFAREGGREYLFGVWTHGAYRCWWATTDAEERAAFEAVVDTVMAAWQSDPGGHVYHFGHYEASAFRRLAGRHATRADALDRLLTRRARLARRARRGLSLIASGATHAPRHWRQADANSALRWRARLVPPQVRGAGFERVERRRTQQRLEHPFPWRIPVLIHGQFDHHDITGRALAPDLELAWAGRLGVVRGGRPIASIGAGDDDDSTRWTVPERGPRAISLRPK